MLFTSITFHARPVTSHNLHVILLRVCVRMCVDVVAPRSSYLPSTLTSPKFDLMDSFFSLPALIQASLQPVNGQPRLPKPKKSSKRAGAHIARSVVMNDRPQTAPGVYVQPPCRCSKCQPPPEPPKAPVANGSPAKHKRRRRVSQECKKLEGVTKKTGVLS